MLNVPTCGLDADKRSCFSPWRSLGVDDFWDWTYSCPFQSLLRSCAVSSWREVADARTANLRMTHRTLPAVSGRKVHASKALRVLFSTATPGMFSRLACSLRFRFDKTSILFHWAHTRIRATDRGILFSACCLREPPKRVLDLKANSFWMMIPFLSCPDQYDT